jgi:hypothetical protein
MERLIEGKERMIGKQKKRTEEILERLRGLSRLGELLMEEDV